MSAYNHAAGLERRTCEWNNPIMMTDMACGAIGGGLFIAAVAVGWLPGAIAGFLVAAVGKGATLLADLPNPLRAPLVFLRPGQSWLAFGGVGFGLFCVFGFLYCLCSLLGASTPVVTALAVLAVLADFAVISYEGLVLATSKGIPAWRGGALPVLYPASALFGGLGIVAAAGSLDLALAATASLQLPLMFLGLVQAFCLAAYAICLRSDNTEHGVAEARLARGGFASWYWGLIFALCTIVPLALVAADLTGLQAPWMLIVAGALAALGTVAMRPFFLSFGEYESRL